MPLPLPHSLSTPVYHHPLLSCRHQRLTITDHFLKLTLSPAPSWLITHTFFLPLRLTAEDLPAINTLLPSPKKILDTVLFEIPQTGSFEANNVRYFIAEIILKEGKRMLKL